LRIGQSCDHVEPTTIALSPSELTITGAGAASHNRLQVFKKFVLPTDSEKVSVDLGSSLNRKSPILPRVPRQFTLKNDSLQAMAAELFIQFILHFRRWTNVYNDLKDHLTLLNFPRSCHYIRVISK
jgi:hypothetical protein